jgi:hypothetical protein
MKIEIQLNQITLLIKRSVSFRWVFCLWDDGIKIEQGYNGENPFQDNNYL